MYELRVNGETVQVINGAEAAGAAYCEARARYSEMALIELIEVR